MCFWPTELLQHLLTLETCAHKQVMMFQCDLWIKVVRTFFFCSCQGDICNILCNVIQCMYIFICYVYCFLHLSIKRWHKQQHNNRYIAILVHREVGWSAYFIWIHIVYNCAMLNIPPVLLIAWGWIQMVSGISWLVFDTHYHTVMHYAYWMVIIIAAQTLKVPYIPIFMALFHDFSRAAWYD